MLKNKRFLLTILLTLVAIILLQVQVKADDFDFSTYDYALTDTGVIAKNDLTGEETIIAIIQGEYTGTIEIIGENTVKLSDFTADGLKFSSEQYTLYIEGVNETALDHGDYFITGDGLLKYFNRGQWLYSSQPHGEVIMDYYDAGSWDANLYNRIFYVGTYIKEMKTVTGEYYKYINMEDSANVDWDKVIEYLGCEIDSLNIYCRDLSVIPSKFFKELEKHPKTHIGIDSENGGYTVSGSEITNSDVDFTIGYDFSYEPKWDMTNATTDDAVYIKFEHSGTVPSPINIWDFPEDYFIEGEKLNCYHYNETTKKYEQVEDAIATNGNTLKLNIDYGSKYVVSKTALPSEIVDGDNSENTDKNWCVETEVDSLVWTEEDINKILADIEETRNNTTDKQLYVHVPSGSKVPAKIFEAANGIDISIISEDGIWAEFSGGSYKAIDYVAGGTISNKAIDGMVNVGEDTIVYLSLKHEGQLPAKCYISYLQGLTGIGLGGDFNFVKTKLYYFNKEAQKYELCGSGAMDLAYDVYVFEIDHCSSYVMSEEALPDEFVIKTTTGEDKEDTKKEEVKKEENKTEDKTKAPGSLPYTGGTFVIILSVLAIIALGVYAYRRNNDLKGI